MPDARAASVSPRRGFSFSAGLLIFILLTAFHSGAFAQEEFLRAFHPEMGNARTSLSHQFTGYSGEDVASQGKNLAIREHRFSLFHPIAQDRQNEWSLVANVRGFNARTAALLPDTKESFPSDLWDINGGLQYRHKFDNGWIGGSFLSVGSASDKPFASDEELTINANAFVRIPDGERNAWLVFLHYANNREFLPHVPLPGIGYMYEPSEQYRFTVGIPFFFAQFRPLKGLTLDLSYFAIRNVQARVAYQIFKPLRLYGGFEWRNERYFRADRADDDKRLFYYEKRLFAGLRLGFGYGFLEVSGGYAFDRFFFEGKNYDHRDENRLEIGNGPYGAVRVGFRF